MSRFLIDKLQSLEAYVPGEQPKDKKYIKLNTNESPYPPSIGVLKALDTDVVGDLKLYCNPECVSLTNEFCRVYDVSRENVIFGNGSDEILNYCFTAFFSDRNPVVFPDITYGFYKVFGDLYHIDYKEIPLMSDFSINLNDYMGIGKNVVIANPNAPTGICLTPDEIEQIAKSNPDNVVVIDEAYIDFGGISCYPLTKKYKNLIVTGTFSKSRSLAGARLGFAIADKELISDLNKIKFSTNPYNINSMTQAVGAAALQDNDYYMNNCQRIIETREFTADKLKALGFEILPSKANFLFARHPEYDGEYLYNSLYEKGILVRHFKKDRIKNYLRITIGTPAEMQALVFALEKITEGR